MVSETSIKEKSIAPLISVVMPAYNAQVYIGKAIESILSQTFSLFELIIVDDNSKDDTWDLILKYSKKDKRIIPLQNKENLKLSKSLNKGIKVACGKYIARMDADDISTKDRLLIQYKFMEKNPDVGIVGGTMEIIDEKGKSIGKRAYAQKDSEIRQKIFLYSPFSHPLIMIRKSVLDQVGCYNHLYNPAEDYELYFRIGQKSKFANLSNVLLKYRIIPKSMTTGSTRKMEQQTIRIRNKYSNTKGYNRSLTDKIYNYIHWLSLYVVPSKLKITIFNYLRNAR